MRWLALTLRNSAAGRSQRPATGYRHGVAHEGQHVVLEVHLRLACKLLRRHVLKVARIGHGLHHRVHGIGQSAAGVGAVVAAELPLLGGLEHAVLAAHDAVENTRPAIQVGQRREPHRLVLAVDGDEAERLGNSLVEAAEAVPGPRFAQQMQRAVRGAAIDGGAGLVALAVDGENAGVGQAGEQKRGGRVRDMVVHVVVPQARTEEAELRHLVDARPGMTIAEACPHLPQLALDRRDGIGSVRLEGEVLRGRRLRACVDPHHRAVRVLGEHAVLAGERDDIDVLDSHAALREDGLHRA